MGKEIFFYSYDNKHLIKQDGDFDPLFEIQILRTQFWVLVDDNEHLPKQDVYCLPN